MKRKKKVFLFNFNLFFYLDEVITFLDYNQMSNDQIIEQDNRSPWRIYKDIFYIRHDLSYSFVYPNIFDPFHIRISYLFLTISITFCINAILFSDEQIENRNLESNKVLITVIIINMIFY